MLVLSLVMITIYPILIAPLFNKFTPLPEGQLRWKIEKLASSLKFPLKKLYVVDGSTRSSHSNAYMYGFFNNKRTVLYDTLIQQCKNDEEIVAVLAHELGHWKLNHTVYLFISVQIRMLLHFGGYNLVRNSSSLFQSFGFDTQPVIIGLIIFQHTIIPIEHLVHFVRNLVSRAFEFQADAFAKKLGYASSLRASLVRLKEENLSAMNTDPWYSAYRYSHPPLVERLAAVENQTRKMTDMRNLCSAHSIEVEDISGSGSIYVQSDGEHLGFLPRKFCILPSAVEMICRLECWNFCSVLIERLKSSQRNLSIRTDPAEKIEWKLKFVHIE